MRVLFAVACLAVAASAVDLAHAPEQAVRHSEFGQSVLQELQSKINAGAPVDELRDIIAEIRQRLTDARNADAAQSAAHQQQCTNDINELTNQINQHQSNIESLAATIASLETKITGLLASIQQQEAIIQEDRNTIAATEQRIQDLHDKRDDDHELYLNRTRDTNQCIEAVEDIKNLGLDSLEAGQGDEAGNYAARDYSTLLEKAADKTTDETAKSFMQLAAVSAMALSADDVTRLKALLDRLDEELKAYLVELTNEEAQSVADYNADLAAENALLAAQQTKLANDIEELNRLNGELDQARSDKAAAEREKAAEEEAKATKERIRADTIQKCNDLQAAHDRRNSERDEEEETLRQIEAIITEKLQSGAIAGHVEDRVSGVSVAN